MNKQKRTGRVCEMCGDPVDGAKQRFCPSCRRIRKRRRRNKTDIVLGQGAECAICGAVFRIKKWNQKYCSKECSKEAERRKRGWENRLGDKMTCIVCGKKIDRTGPRQLMCREMCEGTLRCIKCGKVKPSTDFYDRRYTFEGKLTRTCRVCLKERREHNDNG